MRTIERSSTFKADFKREKKGLHKATIESDVALVVALLAADTPLPASYLDHKLGGTWKGYRDCHVLNDMVLIYAKPDDETLQLARLGSHAELF